MNYTEIGIQKKYISITPDRKKITYIHQDKVYKYSDPEEKVRAEYYIELIEKYQYRPENINFEVVVPRRTPSDIADIVIYKDKKQSRPFVVIEAKKDGITDSEFTQAIEQAFGNANSLRAEYTGTISGGTRRFFDVKNYSATERNKNIIADIPVNFGKVQEFRFKKGDKNWDIQSIDKEKLIRILQKCSDTLWDGGKMNPVDSFDELSKIIFVKIRDEQIHRKEGEPYDFQIKTQETAQSVHERIVKIYEDAKILDPEVFISSIESNPIKLFNVVNHLQGINLSKTDLDTKGVAFEKFMEDFFKGKQGQYFTPREIVSLIIKMCGVKNEQKVLDPACGSGGFLLHCLDYIRSEANEYYKEGTEENFKYWHNFAKNNLFGIEVNERIARVAKMNMIIHDDGHTNVICSDALENINDIQKINKSFKKNYFDLILTNPPFGASVKKEEKNYLSHFIFGMKGKNKIRNSQKTEILFIERCLDFLKDDGYLYIILPDSVLINPTTQYVRDFLFEKVKIVGIISLPDFSFSFYGANVKSSIVILKKKMCGDYNVFLANLNEIGYSASGKKKEENDIPMILEQYKKFIRIGKISSEKKLYGKVYIKNIKDLKKGNRIDPKGYSPFFEKLKKRVAEIPFKKIPLRACISYKADGDWGSSINGDDVDGKNFSLCHVIRNTNFDNHFNANYDDVALRLIHNKYLDGKDIKGKGVKKIKVELNDILIEKSGGSPVQPVGRVLLVKNLPKDEVFVFSNFITLIRVDKNIIDPRVLYSYLKALWNMGYMEYIQSQTNGIRNLLQKEFFDIQVPIIEDKRLIKNICDTSIETMECIEGEVLKSYKKLNDSKNKLENLFQI